MNPSKGELRAILAASRGEALNGKADGLPQETRRLCEYLPGLLLQEREVAFEAWRLTRPEPDAVAWQLAEIAAGGGDGTDDAEAPEERPYKLTPVASIESIAVEWLWWNRIPRGMLSLIAGEPKVGKSLLSMQLSACVSRGLRMPHDGRATSTPGSVIIMNAEDDASRTIRPRLEAAGADLNRVHVLESVILRHGEQSREKLPSLRTDIAAIEQAVRDLADCRLVVIDPVSAFLDGTDDHKNAELRGMLSPLKAMAERTGASVLLVTHLNKSRAQSAGQRVVGSIAYVGASRASFLCIRDVDPSAGEAGKRVLFAPIGCNLAEEPATLTYVVAQDRQGRPRLEWGDQPVQTSADEALAKAAEVSDCGSSAIPETAEWLQAALQDGPKAFPDLKRDASAAGYSERQLRRAKDRLSLVSRRDGFGAGSRVLWSLPTTPAPILTHTDPY